MGGATILFMEKRSSESLFWVICVFFGGLSAPFFGLSASFRLGFLQGVTLLASGVVQVVILGL